MIKNQYITTLGFKNNKKKQWNQQQSKNKTSVKTNINPKTDINQTISMWNANRHLACTVIELNGVRIKQKLTSRTVIPELNKCVTDWGVLFKLKISC